MKIRYACDHCSVYFDNPDDCRKHEIEVHASGIMPKFQKGDVVSIGNRSDAYVVEDALYFGELSNTWIYSLKNSSDFHHEKYLNLICTKEDFDDIWKKAIVFAEQNFSSFCDDSVKWYLRGKIHFDRYFFFTVGVSIEQIKKYFEEKNDLRN
jgi:hypothetical protein